MTHNTPDRSVPDVPWIELQWCPNHLGVACRKPSGEWFCSEGNERLLPSDCSSGMGKMYTWEQIAEATLSVEPTEFYEGDSNTTYTAGDCQLELLD